MPKTTKPKIIKEPTDIVEVDNKIQDSGVEMLIAKAIDKDTSVDVMEKLLLMRKEFLAEQAKKAFDEAMANFQGDCPVIKKTTDGGQTKGGQVAYKYATIGEIVNQVKEFIQKNGLSYIIKTEVLQNGETKVKATCIVKHQLGHSEESAMEVPLGQQTAVMSSPQVVASASTFAKRYAFCNAFGIMTGDDDNDAQSAPKTTTPQSTAKPEPTYHPDPQTPETKHHCSRHWNQLKEKVEITKAEAEYSKKNCGFELCRACQTAFKEAKGKTPAPAPKQAEKPVQQASQDAKDIAEVNSWGKKDSKETKEDLEKVGKAVDTEDERLENNIDRAKTVGKAQKIV